jgi:hypothetical protein
MGANMFLEKSWSVLSSNPAVAATVLLVGYIGVMAWVWWPAGVSLP